MFFSLELQIFPSWSPELRQPDSRESIRRLHRLRTPFFCKSGFGLAMQILIKYRRPSFFGVQICPFNTVSCYRPKRFRILELDTVSRCRPYSPPEIWPKSYLMRGVGGVGDIVPQSKSLEHMAARLFKKSAAVCASLSTKVPDNSIFRLIMHKNPGFCSIHMNNNPGFYSIFRLIMHKIPGIYSIFRHKNPGFCSMFRFNMYHSMDRLKVTAFVGSDGQDLVHDSRGPLSPLLSLASVYIFRPRFVIQALFLGSWS